MTQQIYRPNLCNQIVFLLSLFPSILPSRNARQTSFIQTDRENHDFTMRRPSGREVMRYLLSFLHLRSSLVPDTTVVGPSYSEGQI